MTYLLSILIPIIILAILHFKTDMQMEKKLTFAAVLFSVILGATYYNSIQNRLRETIIKNELIYDQNRTLECYSQDLQKKIDVNQTFFSYSTGTQTFIGKEKTPFYNLMVNIEECKK